MGNMSYPNKAVFQDYPKMRKVTSFPLISNAVLKYAVNGKLTLEGFNQCVAEIFHCDMYPLFAYTYLSECLFKLLDFNNEGMIPNERFSIGVCNILAGSEIKSKMLFEAMKLDKNKNFLTLDEINFFYLKSFIYAFNSLYGFTIQVFKNEFDSKDIPIPKSLQDFQSVVSKHSTDIKLCVTKSLLDSGVNIDAQIDYFSFKKWNYKNNTIEIKYANKTVCFATNLIFLESMGLNPNCQ